MLFEPQVTTRALSHAAGPRDVPLLELTIGEGLRRTVERFGDREALVVREQGYRATYRELWDEVGLAARGLLARGVRPGDRVGIWAPNRYEWVVIQYATARIGAILVTINPAYKAAELEYALARTGVSLLVLARGFRQSDYVAMLDEVRPQCPLLRETVVLEDDWEDLLADGEDVAEADLEAIEATLHPDDPINIQYTSGTTGAPKGATLSHRNILNNGYFTGLILRYTEDDRVCVPVPFYHCFGMVLGNLACLTHGACLVVPGASFDPRRHAARRRGGALHVAVRRADDVHRRARASALRRLRPVEPAHGDHGRRALPGRGDERRSARGCTWTRSRSAAA